MPAIIRNLVNGFLPISKPIVGTSLKYLGICLCHHQMISITPPTFKIRIRKKICILQGIFPEKNHPKDRREYLVRSYRYTLGGLPDLGLPRFAKKPSRAIYLITIIKNRFLVRYALLIILSTVLSWKNNIWC